MAAFVALVCAAGIAYGWFVRGVYEKAKQPKSSRWPYREG